MTDERPTHLDLFSGIGGFSLAAEAAGFQTIGFSEIEPYPSAVLRKDWPNVPNYGSIDRLPTYWFRGVDLLTGGFPCQPFSFAGKRSGSRDHRALWPKMFRVIAETRPAFVLGENVLGIVNMELDRCLSDLESLGYSCRPLVVPACAVDAKHIRKRVWIVANSGRGRFRIEAPTDADWSGEALADADEPGLQGRDSEELRECESERFAGASGSSVSDSTIERRLQGCQDSGGNSEGAGTPEERRGLTDPCRWPTEPELGRVAHGIPHRSHRLKGLGNAIVPQVAEVFLRAIYQQLTA